MRHILSFALLLILPFVLAADDAPAPRSAPAVKALQKHDQAMKAADAAWLKAATEAQRTLIQELEDAKAGAMKANDLAEANSVQLAIEDAKRELDAMMGRAKTFRVAAGADWQPAMAVKQGEVYRVTLKGRWCANTSNRVKYTFEQSGVADGDWFGLQGRIDTGTTFRIEGGSITASKDGMLMLKLQGNDPRNDDGAVHLTLTPVR